MHFLIIANSLLTSDSYKESTTPEERAYSETESTVSFNSEELQSIQSIVSSDEGEKHVLQRYYDQIVDIVDKLFDVSILIRRTSQSFRATRAAAHVERDTEGNDVISEFRKIVLLKLRGLCCLETPKWLVERLAEVTAMRRRQFYYQRAHKRHLARIPTEFQEEIQVASKDMAPSRSVIMSASAPTTTAQTRAAPRTKAETTTKTYDTIATELKREDGQTKPLVLANFTPSEKRIKENIFPSSPKEPKGKAFECSQCFHVLPDEMRDDSLWRLSNFLSHEL